MLKVQNALRQQTKWKKDREKQTWLHWSRRRNQANNGKEPARQTSNPKPKVPAIQNQKYDEVFENIIVVVF